MGRELEWKYSATKHDIEAVFHAYCTDWKRIEMETTYYDTPTHELGAKKMTLRRRYENGNSVCTLKTAAENGARGEWECEQSDIRTAIAKLCALGAPSQLLSIGTLIEVCAARFTRFAAMLELPQCAVEIALDCGQLLGGGKSAPLCEIEVEHKRGSEQASEEFARSLAARFFLSEEPMSKYRRALALTEEDNTIGG